MRICTHLVGQVVPGNSNPSIHTYTDATFKRKVKEDKEERRLLRADMGEMKDEVGAHVHAHVLTYMHVLMYMRVEQTWAR